jgi:8-oxo-dGTP pyrophosphatase MutT (NUDIX family)
MPHERSAGVVIYHQEKDQIKYLMLRYIPGHWDFPRGHVEPGEDDEQTARREIKEETGIDGLEILPGFKEKISWFYRKKDEPKPRFKEAVYFLARCSTLSVNLSPEHTAFKWLDFESARKQATFINARQVLDKANKFLTQSHEG